MKIGFSIALAVAICAAGASATPTTYGFEGTLSAAEQFVPIPEWQFERGQRFYGEFVYDVDRITDSLVSVSKPDWTMTVYRSPLVSMRFAIELPGEDYSFDVPTQNLTDAAYQFTNVTQGTGGPTGVFMRAVNYPVDGHAGPPSMPLPPSAYVGAYSPYMADILIGSGYEYGPDSYKLLPDTSPDIDLAALFGASQGLFTARFSNSYAWGAGETVHASMHGWLDRVWVIAPVPEPQSWALMILGFGVAGVALRHSRGGQARAV